MPTHSNGGGGGEGGDPGGEGVHDPQAVTPLDAAWPAGRLAGQLAGRLASWPAGRPAGPRFSRANPLPSSLSPSPKIKIIKKYFFFEFLPDILYIGIV